MSQVELPEGWLNISLGEVTQIVGGGTPSRNNTAFFKGNIRWATPTDVTKLNELWIDETKERITEAGLKNSSAKLLPIGTVLMTSRATIGVTAIAKREICTNQGFANFICNDQVLFNEYLAYWLSSVKDYLIGLSGGTTFKEISKSTLATVRMPLPSLSEQRHIVSIINEANEMLRLRHKSEEKSKNLSSSILYEMLGDPSTNPRKWEIIKLGQACERITDGTHQPPSFVSRGIPFLFVSNIVGGRIDFNTEKFISDKTYRTLMRRCPVEVGDILYSTVGSYGTAVLVDTDRPFSFQRHIAHIKPDRSRLDPLFLTAILNSSYVRGQADRTARGIAQKTVNLGEIEKFTIYLPQLSAQQDFARKIRLVRTLEDEQQKTKERFNNLAQSIFAQSFSGDLTTQWREQHKAQLRDEASERDEILGQLGRSRYEQEEIIDEVRPAASERERLLSKLSRKQFHVLEVAKTMIRDHPQTLSKNYFTAWDIWGAQQRISSQGLAEAMKGYFTSQQIKDTRHEIKPVFSHTDAIQSLHLLADMGLLRRVRVETDPAGEGVVVFAPAYRQLSKEDDSRLADLGLLETERA